MTNLQTALIQFTPLEPYFFGGESTHGSLGADANYFSKSNPYPQQTTLLGTLRNLLRLAGYPFGKHSFSPHNSNLTDFGDLESISPLFLQKIQEDGTVKFFLRQALDRQGDGEPFQIMQHENDEWLLFDGALKFQSAARWQGYKPKTALADEWISRDGERVAPDEIFKTFIRPGIPKQELRKQQESQKREASAPGLFKQELVQLKKGWSFALLAKFDEDVDLLEKLDGATAQLGGEKSIFQISVQLDTRCFEQIFPPEEMFYSGNQPNLPRLVLVSDAEIPEDAWQYIVAAVTETTDFRHLQTFFNNDESRSEVKIGKLSKFQPKGKTVLSKDYPLGKSTKFTLLRRGSVLVCPDAETLDQLVQELSIEPWCTAGFNHFFKYDQTTSKQS